MPTIPAWRVEPVAAALRRLLAEPADPAELLVAACHEPPPGPGWLPLYFVSCRLHLYAPGVPPARKHHFLKAALLDLERRGEVELITQALRSRRARFTLKRRVRWVRLVRGAAPRPPAPCCAACGRPLPDGRVP